MSHFTLQHCVRRARRVSIRPLVALSSVACLLISLPGMVQAANRAAPDQMMAVKGQSCGALWLQQAQYPYTVATIVQSSLSEIDGITGDVVQNVGLCGGSWSQPVFQTDPVPYETLSYEKDFLFDGSQVTFTFTANVFDQSSTIPDQGQQLQFPTSSVTYAVAISGWPFLSFDDTLQLKDTAMILSSADKQARVTQSQTLTQPQSAQVDGIAQPLALQSKVLAGGRGVAITLGFPDFGQASYNPLPTPTPSPTATGTPGS